MILSKIIYASHNYFTLTVFSSYSSGRGLAQITILISLPPSKNCLKICVRRDSRYGTILLAPFCWFSRNISKQSRNVISELLMLPAKMDSIVHIYSYIVNQVILFLQSVTLKSKVFILKTKQLYKISY